jgi:cytochrome c-type biogenesis protein CcmH
MTGFIVWAALAAVVAALFVALPLVRPRAGAGAPHFALAASVSLLVLVCTAALYVKWSHGSWRAAPAAETAGIEALLAATEQRPDDVQAWLNLGRGYLRISQWPLARRSFEHADRLSQGRNADALGGMAESMVLESGGELTPAATALFDRALQVDPHSPAALFYSGVAQLNAGNLEAARAHFSALRELGPPPQVTAALDKQIAAIDAELAPAKPDPATAIQLHVSLDPALVSRVPANAVLFVFVQAPGGGPPLAAKRLAPQLPQDLTLSASDSMIAGRGLKPGQHVQVMARLSASGAPTASAGDLQGALPAVAGSKSTYQLRIGQPMP